MTRSNAMTKLLAVFTAVAVCTGCTHVGIRDTQTIHFDDKEVLARLVRYAQRERRRRDRVLQSWLDVVAWAAVH